jgi:ABC-type nitrate/sulfonate/bicarbonate transport system substrate-binding protein
MRRLTASSPRSPRRRRRVAERPQPPRRLAAALAASAGIALALAGCGGSGTADRPNADATIVLAGAPDALDAPLATTVQRGFDQAEGVSLTLRRPRAAGAGLRALENGSAQFAALDAATLSDHRDLVGVMALRANASGARAPWLVLTTTRASLNEDPSVARATVRALVRGYATAQVDPASTLADLKTLYPRLEQATIEHQFNAGQQQLFPPGRPLGGLPRADPRYDPAIDNAAQGALNDD